VFVFVSAMLPAYAADSSLIGVAKSTDLALPAANAPAGYVARPSQGYAITRATMRPMLGNHLTSAFEHYGWTSGYHGWLDAIDLRGNMFVTYDLFGFKSAAGAQAAQASYVGLIPGVESSITDRRMPKGASVFIDQTGTYGQGQPFVVVEIVFRTDNVLGDITGYYSGGDAVAANSATASTIAAASAIATWLNGQAHPVGHQSALFLPFALPLLTLGLRVRGRQWIA
jgi:hypothetical protein